MQTKHIQYAIMALAGLLFFGVLLSLCSSPRTAYQPAPIAQPVAAAPAVVAAPAAAPVIVNAPASSGASDMLLGAAAGYMVGSSTRSHANTMPPAPATRPVVNKTIIKQTIVVQRPPARAAARPAPARFTSPARAPSSSSRVSLRK